MATRSLPVLDPIETDAVVVGAGPVGLFQVFELGLLVAPIFVRVTHSREEQT